MQDQIRLFVGRDPAETVGFHAFVESVLRRTDQNRISITGLSGVQGDASTTFSKVRFRIPEFCGYNGWAIWCDGSDMLCRADIRELWDLRKMGYDLMVVPHEYRTKYSTKFLGQPNENYPRKNQSSLMLINCGSAVWRRPAYKKLLEGPAGLFHKFAFLEEERIGHLPYEWNWLVGEMPYNPEAKLVHFTIGGVWWKPYQSWDYADEWRDELKRVNHYQPWDVEAYDDSPLVSER
jgi:hypothetical protein